MMVSGGVRSPFLPCPTKHIGSQLGEFLPVPKAVFHVQKLAGLSAQEHKDELKVGFEDEKDKPKKVRTEKKAAHAESSKPHTQLKNFFKKKATRSKSPPRIQSLPRKKHRCFCRTPHPRTYIGSLPWSLPQEAHRGMKAALEAKLAEPTHAGMTVED